jgi:sec-independent protein translocase protein TatC
MTPMEHLRELRTRLMRAVVAIGICTLLLLWPAPHMIKTLVAWYFPGQTLHAFGPTDVIGAEFRFALFGGIVLGLPAIVVELWFFVAPAFAPRTRRLVYLLTAPSLILAALGIVFCHFFILPRIAGALLALTGDVAQPTFGIAPTINLILALFLAFALIFQTPLLLIALARMGLINGTMLRQYRRHALMGSLLIGGVAAPDGSPITMLLLAIPMYILYEISILILIPLERAWNTAQSSDASTRHLP